MALYNLGSGSWLALGVVLWRKLAAASFLIKKNLWFKNPLKTMAVNYSNTTDVQSTGNTANTPVNDNCFMCARARASCTPSTTAFHASTIQQRTPIYTQDNSQIPLLTTGLLCTPLTKAPISPGVRWEFWVDALSATTLWLIRVPSETEPMFYPSLGKSPLS